MDVGSEIRLGHCRQVGPDVLLLLIGCEKRGRHEARSRALLYISFDTSELGGFDIRIHTKVMPNACIYNLLEGNSCMSYHIRSYRQSHIKYHPICCAARSANFSTVIPGCNIFNGLTSTPLIPNSQFRNSAATMLSIQYVFNWRATSMSS